MRLNVCCVLFVVVCLALFGGAASGAHPMTPAEKEQETKAINALLDQWTQGDLKKDITPFLDTMAPDMVLVGTDENEIVVGKKAIAEILQKVYVGIDKVTQGSYSDRLVFFSRDGNVAWLICKVASDFIAGGKPMSVKGMRNSFVFEKRDGKWMLVHEHASFGVPPQPVGNVGK